MKNKDPYHWTNIVGLNERIFGKFQPERPNPEACEGNHYNTKKENFLSEFSWKCEKCGTLITRCDGLNTMGT